MPIKSQTGPAPLGPPKLTGRPALYAERNEKIRARVAAGEDPRKVADEFGIRRDHMKRIIEPKKPTPPKKLLDIEPVDDDSLVLVDRDPQEANPDFAGLPAQLDEKPGRTLAPNQRNLLLRAARHFCTERELAALLDMSPSTLSRIMKRKDPATRLTYREIWDRGREAAGGALKILMGAQSNNMTSWGVQQAQFIAKNMLGWSDKKTEVHEGTVHHTHQRIPDGDLKTYSVEQLEQMVGDATGGKKQLRH